MKFHFSKLNIFLPGLTPLPQFRCRNHLKSMQSFFWPILALFLNGYVCLNTLYALPPKLFHRDDFLKRILLKSEILLIMDRCFYICCRRDCPRRSLDSGRIYNYLKLNNWKPTKRVRHADLIIVYTCGGFQQTEKRSLRTIRRVCAQKKNSAILVVTGCLVKINPEAISRSGNPYILEHQDLYKLDNLVHAKIPYSMVPDANIVPDVRDLDARYSIRLPLRKFLRELQFSSAFIKKSLGFVKRKIASQIKPHGPFSDEIYNLKIAHGCLGKCTYCAIKLATGTLKSKPIEKILEEFKNGLAEGYRRFVLIAEDTGCYGLDIGTNIVHLLRKIYDVEKSFSLIINDFNVNWLIKYYDNLLPLFLKNKDKIEDIRIPIQSGSDKILKLMGRPYRIHDVKSVISDLKAKLPDLKICTHILVGFPGETEWDFEQSRKFLKEFDFEEVVIYCYEERPRTSACLMPEKVPINIREKRASALRWL